MVSFEAVALASIKLAAMAGREKSNHSNNDHSTRPGTSAPNTVTSDADPFINITRDNGVVFKVEDNVPIAAYVDAFTDLLNPNSVVSASRISNGRAAIYLKTRQDVEDAVMYGFKYNETFIEVSPMVQPTTRLILSNVYPEIPNDVLNRNLSGFCKVVSRIRPIPLGIKTKELSHVYSFRRQVHVLIGVDITIPDHMNIAYNGVNYRVFLSNDSVKCFNCGESGHISKNCKKKSVNNDNPLNPPPVFHHSKSDPKHPSKSRPPMQPSVHSKSPHSSNPNQEASNLSRSSLPKENSREAPSLPSTSRTNEDNRNGLVSAPVKKRVEPHKSVPKQNKSGDQGKPNTDPISSNPLQESSSKSTSSSPSAPQPSKFISVWGSPPQPSRLFSEVVTKRKKIDSPEQSVPGTKTKNLIPLKSPSPPRKITKQVSSPMEATTPTTSQALEVTTPTHSSPAGSSAVTEEAESDLDSVSWEDTDQSQESQEHNIPQTKGPLSNQELIKFLKAVKSKKKPDEIARKFTNDIPGLVKQLMPLRNSSLVQKKTQHRIRKLIKTLDPNDPLRL